MSRTRRSTLTFIPRNPGDPSSAGSITHSDARQSSTPAAPVTLVERFHVDYTAAAGPTFESNLMATLTTTTAGTITVTSGVVEITNVMVGGGLPYLVGIGGTVTGATLPGAQPSVIAVSSAR